MTQRLRIEGRGPVAIALRLYLARQGVAPAAIAHDAFAEQIPPAVAARPLALSLGSTHLLSRIVTLPQAAPIRTVDVSLARRGGRTRFRAEDLDSPTLGCVVRYAALHRALVEALQRIDAASRSPSPFPLPPSPLVGEADEITIRAGGAPTRASPPHPKKMPQTPNTQRQPTTPAPPRAREKHPQQPPHAQVRVHPPIHHHRHHPHHHQHANPPHQPQQ
ncbi:MAG: hypothetical protein LT102_05430, partial [Burkholderiaceae bacterium]|nr:hypothetical protein [Burkholderiaceae bacterium]